MFADNIFNIYDSFETELLISNMNSSPEPYRLAIVDLAVPYVRLNVLVRKMYISCIMKSPVESCLFDPIPVWFIKQNVSMLLVPITSQIVDNS